MGARKITSLRRAEGAEIGFDCNDRAGFVRIESAGEVRMEKKWPPSQNVFFPELMNLAPRDLRKYGYRITRGMEYRLYTMTEIDRLIEEGKIVPIKEKSNKPDIFEPGDEL